MKKLFISALAAILAFTSCSLLDEPVYTLTNASAYLNYKDQKLYTDGGIVFNVTSDATDGNWKTDGNRMYALFDVLNINYDITLKKYLNATILAPEKNSEPENAPGDPVTVMDCSLSGGYLNIILGIYVKKGSDTPHNMHLYWSDDSRTMSFVLVHEAGGESILDLPESEMESDTRLFCFPIYNLAAEGESRMIELTINALSKNTDGTYTAEPFTYSVFNDSVNF
ncbi:MAG: hypothetical protein J5745_00130 [Bacteroidales bacterium]|nr:hypothetical protein [Bacteroidales bacterium]